VQAHYILIPLAALAVVLAGGLITRSGSAWFRTLRVPSGMPQARLMTAMWTMLAVLACISAILAWDASPERDRAETAALYLVNAFLNVAFSYLFFARRQMGSATLEAALLAISVALIGVQVWTASWIAAVLLAPYLVWVLYAGWLSFAVFRLNTRVAD
jgi:tryptophan-rich sensory protein